MQFRLKTSKETMDILKQLQSSTNLTPNVLARLAIALSLLSKEPIESFESDTNGLEFNRNTLTGEYDFVYKALIAQQLGRPITDDEYFPSLIKKHLDRGAKWLENEYKYAGNYEKLIKGLANFELEMIR
ncbi:DNA sulfur modification protein DndE [Geobacillus stearothermophilus]|nr:MULTISPECIES: DNA sulfur modification protein DndE [Geobacillus]MED4923478.1 DNA sulfur modification protein DndE [Anoxybacillus geothermalis]AGE22667.1 DNA sulfur modification protein [Geobacillus sp. GHH01]MED4270328.1 DNA sulfur modification protein DndE [Geobacillus stearothermophilus]MED4299139.1 DNA sulfur modification protein DndE [Geobacillus stearothermophilus]RXS84264.1 DNA sulfur modification protein DndE [Geobacillus sp. PK12]